MSRSRGLKERGSRQATASPRFRCATLIRNNKATTIQTPGSGYEDPGLSESNPASTYDKASWHAQAITHVHDQVMWFRHTGTAMTSNIKEIKGTTVNPESSKSCISINLDKKTFIESGWKPKKKQVRQSNTVA